METTSAPSTKMVHGTTNFVPASAKQSEALPPGCLSHLISSSVLYDTEGRPQRRILLHPHHGHATCVLEHIDPNKLNIKTLTDVFRHCWDNKPDPKKKAEPFESNGQSIISDDLFSRQSYHFFPMNFKFDHNWWDASVTNMPDRRFFGKRVHFINIKMPSDGYVFNDLYVENPAPDQSLIIDDDTDELVETIFEAIEPLFAKVGGVEFDNFEHMYETDTHRVWFRWWSPSGKHAVKITWEYGLPTKIFKMTDAAKALMGRRAQNRLKRLAAKHTRNTVVEVTTNTPGFSAKAGEEAKAEGNTETEVNT